jgi:asparagine synthase (glutamine-hydrolysing)
MCGICGELSFAAGQRVQEPSLLRMAGALTHRGPDHGAAFVSADARGGLGFRRLSIIDLRPAANQPLPNEDGSVRLVFNGEIYNFQELRRGLVSRGHVFRSNADSEVIVHLYEELGDRAINELDGMFALGIWDSTRRRLLLARDRAGKKPLFVWQGSGRVVFASEIKALAAHPDVTLLIDESALPYYFLYGYVPHPQTFYRGVTHVEPGTVVEFDEDGRRTERKYWQLTFPPPAPSHAHDRPAAVVRVRELVTAAVERRLTSDVPLGAFLSGGIDSAIIVGVMSRLASKPVRTFSIGFDDDPAFDESAEAKATAKHFRTDHTEFRVRPSAVDLLDTLVYHHDGPFADSSAIPTYLVSKLTREHVTVALTGDGGDEVFAGYLRFGAALTAERTPQWMALGMPLLRLLPQPRNERSLAARSARFLRFLRLPLEDRLTAFAGVFYDDLDRLLEASFAAATDAIDRRRHIRSLKGIDGASPLSRLLATNFHSYLHDDLLVKTDRMSMANSLEARSPFLDRALVEYVAGLPDDEKLKGMTTKAILREAFDHLLPAAVQRAPKKGFGVPLEAWFRGELREMCRDVLLSPSAKLRSYLSQDYVRKLVDDHQAGRANHGHRLWTVLTFERWLALLPSWVGPR